MDAKIAETYRKAYARKPLFSKQELAALARMEWDKDGYLVPPTDERWDDETALRIDPEMLKRVRQS